MAGVSQAFAIVLFLVLGQSAPTDLEATLPEHAQLLLQATGRGVQIYRCTQTQVAWQWSLVAPEADLFTPGTDTRIGSHGAGPRWVANDGSAITGKVLAKAASPEAGSVPWLLLAATQQGTAAGLFARVAFVRRSETHGGNAPGDGCDERHADATLRVPYTATYTFYSARM